MRALLLILILVLAACKVTPPPDATQTPFVVTATGAPSTSTPAPPITPTRESGVQLAPYNENWLIGAVYTGVSKNDPNPPANGSIDIPMAYEYISYVKTDTGEPMYPESEFILTDASDGVADGQLSWSLASFGGRSDGISDSSACYTYDRIFFTRNEDGDLIRYVVLVYAGLDVTAMFDAAALYAQGVDVSQVEQFNAAVVDVFDVPALAAPLAEAQALPFTSSTLGMYVRVRTSDERAFITPYQWFVSPETGDSNIEFQWVLEFEYVEYATLEFCLIAPYATIRSGKWWLDDIIVRVATGLYGGDNRTVIPQS